MNSSGSTVSWLSSSTRIAAFRRLHTAAGQNGTAPRLLSFPVGVIFLQNCLHDFGLVRIGDLPVSPIFHHVWLTVKGNPPLEKQLEVDLHGMVSGFHHHKSALRQGLQFIRRQERPFNHLNRLRWIVPPLTDRAGLDRPTAQGFGQNFGGTAVGREPAEDGELGIVYNDFRPFLPVVFFQLTEGLDDRDDLQAAASRSTEHHLGAFYLWEGAVLIAKEDTTVLELATVFVRNRQDFPVQLLDEQ